MAIKTQLKIAYIGGGSREWARKLMFDLALCPELTGEVALFDIDTASAQLNEQLGNWLQEQPGVLSRWRYSVSSTLKNALRGADFVVISIQPGTLEIMAEEIAIAERYGMYFPVGDTTGAPGLVRGLRAASTYVSFAEAINTFCPNAWVINYTNPMSICTRTLMRVAPDLKVFGCCHEVYAVQSMLARLAHTYLKTDAVPERAEIKVNVIGINHFTWIDRAEWDGHDLLAMLREEHLPSPETLRPRTQREVEAWGDWFRSADRVKFTLFQRFGILAAAGDRHLVEFLPGFTHSPENLFAWGVIRTPVSWRMQRWQTAQQRTQDILSGATPLNLKASGEEGVGQIKALVGLGELSTNVNLKNDGQISNLPLGAVVETNAHFSRDSVRPLAAGAIPQGLAPLIGQHSANQQIIVEAALSKNKELAFQAIFNDPSNRLDIDSAWNMYTELLQASRAYLPDFI